MLYPDARGQVGPRCLWGLWGVLSVKRIGRRVSEFGRAVKMCTLCIYCVHIYKYIIIIYIEREKGKTKRTESPMPHLSSRRPAGHGYHLLSACGTRTYRLSDYADG